MYCPKCESEYRVGFTRCGECGVNLVQELPAVAETEGQHTEPAVVFTTLNTNEAALVKSLLEGSGVEVWVLDEHLSRMDSPIAIVIGGAKIAVPPAQRELALDVLNEYRGRAGQDPAYGRATPFQATAPYPQFEVAGDDGDSKCPHCQATVEPESTVCAGCGKQPW